MVRGVYGPVWSQFLEDMIAYRVLIFSMKTQ